MSSAGKSAIDEEKGTCEMLIELHPLIEVEQEYLSKVPVPAASETCEGAVVLVKKKHLRCVRYEALHHPDNPEYPSLLHSHRPFISREP